MQIRALGVVAVSLSLAAVGGCTSPMAAPPDARSDAGPRPDAFVLPDAFVPARCVSPVPPDAFVPMDMETWTWRSCARPAPSISTATQ